MVGCTVRVDLVFFSRNGGVNGKKDQEHGVFSIQLHCQVKLLGNECM